MTSGSGEHEAELLALESILELKGADSPRWSAAERERFAALIEGDATARRLVAEARALDRLMGVASAEAPRPAQHAMLASRILAAAEAERAGTPAEPATRPAEDDTGAGSGNVVPLRPQAHAPRAPASPFGGWASGLVAASLFVGVLAGSSGITDPVLGPAIAAISDGADDGDDETELAFNAEGGELGGEEPW